MQRFQKVAVTLLPLLPEDREQFILDNQWAFKYGAQQEFGMRDESCEEGEEVISRKTIENSIDGENAETYRIVLDGQKVGGVVLRIDKNAAQGELELLFVLPEVHSKGIGQSAWKAVEAMHVANGSSQEEVQPIDSQPVLGHVVYRLLVHAF